MSQRFVFGPLSLDCLDLQRASDWVLTSAAEGRACVVVTSNIQHLHLAKVDPQFHRVLAEAELNVADGWPLILASRLIGDRPLPERVAGVDLVSSVLASDTRLRLAILGGAPGAGHRLAERLDGRHEVVLVEPLTIGTWDEPAFLNALERRFEALAPNLVLIAIGAPRQELLAAQLRSRVKGPIICCGAAVELIAGLRPRAPKAMRATGLEWAFRAVLEPSRLVPRYLTSGRTFILVLARGLARR